MRELEYAQVVVGLGTVVVVNETQTKALIGETTVADADGHMAEIVPDVGELLIGLGETESALEARDYHVVLLRVEAAQTDVVEDLAVVDAHLHETPVELERHLGLIVVEVVGCYVRHGLDVRAVRVEHLFVVFYRFVHVAQVLQFPSVKHV